MDSRQSEYFHIGDVISGDTDVYLIESFLGQGASGMVVQCRSVYTYEKKAVKIIAQNMTYVGEREAAIHKQLDTMDETSKNHFGRFIELFACRGHICLVFEMLDLNLYQILKKRRKPMSLTTIRIITESLLRALNVLKSMHLAHTDIKLDNIMLKLDSSQPFNAKLIDFGITTNVSRLWRGSRIQALAFRSPEVILGLPLTEAVDMWSLGCVMSCLYLDEYLYPVGSEYEIICAIVQMFGQPSHHLLNSGIHTTDFFHKDQESPSAPWRLNTPEEYSHETGIESSTDRCRFKSLNDLACHIPARKEFCHEDPRAFVDLLKKIMNVDPTKRITPSEALNHGFITGEYVHSESDQSNSSASSSQENCSNDPNEETTSTAGGTADSHVTPPSKVTQIVARRGNLFHIEEVLSGKLSKYQIEDVLGKGNFGTLIQCRDLSSKEKVLVKIMQKNLPGFGEEQAARLKQLNSLDENSKSNFVRFIEHFVYRGRICLAYEMLDFTLPEIMQERQRPLTLHDIGIMAKGLLWALYVLKSKQLAHLGIKPQNIMIKFHPSQPFSVKLIDFTFTTEVSELWRGTCCQDIGYRAPEVTLGQPLNEAVDMWSLGCVLAYLYLGEDLYSTRSEYQCITDTVRMQGQPGDHLLNSGIFTQHYFHKATNHPNVEWILKTPQEYYHNTDSVSICVGRFNSFNDLACQLPARNEFEDEDPQAFVDLLRQMLSVDPKERITPTEALEHAFIKDRHVHRPSVHDLQLKSDSTSLTSEECELEQSSDQPSSSASSNKDMGSNHSNGNIIMVVSAADKDDDPPATENMAEATATSSNERNSGTADPAADGNNDGLQTTENLDETSVGSLKDRFFATAYASTDGNNDDPPAAKNMNEATATSSNERNSDTADQATDENNDGMQTTENLDETSEGSLKDRTSATAYPTTDGNNDDPPATENLDEATAASSNERNSDTADPATDRNNDGPLVVPAGTIDPASPVSVNQNPDETDNGTCEEAESFVEVKTKIKWLKRVQLFFSRIGKLGSCCSKNTVAVIK